MLRRFKAPLVPGGPTLAAIPLFSTATHGPQDAYSAWRDGGGDLTQVFDTTPTEPFACSTEWLKLGDTELGYSTFSAQHWSRTRLMAARDGYDQLIVNFRLHGAERGQLGDRTVDAPNGSIVLNDLSLPQEHYSEASYSVGIVLPREEAEAAFGPVRALHGHVVDPRHAALINGHLSAIRANVDHLPASAGPALGTTVMDLLTVAIKISLGGELANMPAAERVLDIRVREAIARDLGSPSLNVARLSRTLGVSRSTLYRLMEPEGGVQAYIRARRLDKVAEALRTSGPETTLSMLADRWGFCDAAYLGRSFREAFGMTPGDYRDKHRSR
jgi:AraC-like DNA-binding protein